MSNNNKRPAGRQELSAFFVITFVIEVPINQIVLVQLK